VRLYLCGVRGSTPAPGADFLRYGGHTSCVAIAHDDAARPTLVLDAGTGLRQVTPLLGGQPFDGTILLTHLHWDHVHGLPFFTGGDCEGSRVSLLLPEQEDGASAEQALAKGMSPPHFPIGPGQLRGAWTFDTVAPGQLKAEGFTIEARAIPHKGGATLGYRVSDGSSVIAYLPDHCPTALGPGPEGWGEYHAAALELASGADVLLHDAFLLADEVPAEAFFGHAAIDYAIGLGRRAGARRVVLTHHKPGRTDAALDEVASRVAGVRGEVPGRPALPEVIVAAEGEIFEL
jgi:phosphoribosyl 1,2-cyclic phosphodiesterase